MTISSQALGVSLCCTLLVPAAALCQDTTWQAQTRAIANASDVNDTAAFRAHLIALQRMVGTTPRLAARLARAGFFRGDTADGVRWSVALAAMGVPFDTTDIGPYLRPHGMLDSLRGRNARAMSVVDPSQSAWHFADPDMVTEDVTYDAPRQRFLISSVRRGAVYAVDKKTGAITALVVTGGVGAWGLMGIGIDVAQQTLWVTTAAFPGGAAYQRADSGKTALLRYDLISGALRQSFPPPDSGSHLFGDLTVGSDGTVYVSDGFGGGVYQLERGAKALRPLIPTGTLSSPQTPALSPDGRRLFVPDYTFGIAVVELVTGRWHWLAHPDTLALTGIDGLYQIKGDLIAVQNGLTPNRIVRLGLGANDRVERATTLVRGGEGVDLTHAIWVDGQLYFITRAGWDRVGDDGSITPGKADETPVIRRLPL